MVSFASSVNLVVSKQASKFSDAEAYLVRALVEVWKKEYSAMSNESYRGNLKLERYLEDMDIELEDMSEMLRSQTSYGMREMLKN